MTRQAATTDIQGYLDAHDTLESRGDEIDRIVIASGSYRLTASALRATLAQAQPRTDAAERDERLAQIAARASDKRCPAHHAPCSATVCGSRVCQTARDRDYLLALVREQRTALDERG